MQFRKVFALVGTALTALSSCAENDVSLFVAGVVRAEAPECAVKADPGTDLMLSGVMDIGFTRSYTAVVLVANQLSPRGNKEQLRSETMGFQVRGGEVRLTDSTGNLIQEFSTPSSGFSNPSSSNTPGYGISRMTLIPADVGNNLAQRLQPGSTRTVIAEIRVFGTTAGGAEVTSGSHTFTIEVCHTCLLSFVEGGLTADAEGNLRCDYGVTEELKMGCAPGQDDPTDCRACISDECRNARF